MRTIDQRLKRIRRRLHLSQAELAKRLGVCGSTIAHWETGFSQPREKALEGGMGEKIDGLESEAKETWKRETREEREKDREQEREGAE